jgi:CRP-like cAMP-binding protein
LGDRIYIISRGKAEVVRNDGDQEFSLALLGPGEYFGEMALLNQTTRNATVRCLESLDVLSIHKREFNVLAANLPAMRDSFEQVMKQRRLATESVIAEAAR